MEGQAVLQEGVRQAGEAAGLQQEVGRAEADMVARQIRSLSPRTSDYMASEDGLRTVPARCAASVTSAESEVLAIFGNKELANFEDAAKRTLEFAALPADAQSEKQQSEFPAGVPRPHVTRNWGKWLEKECIERGLTDVRHGKFTPGLFAKKWSAKALEPVEELPEDATSKPNWNQTKPHLDRRFWAFGKSVSR